jgi:hypothetical protein
MTSELDSEKKILINYEEKIIGDLSKSVETLNTIITNFQKEELRKQAEREAELKKKREEELQAAQKEADRKSGIQQKILEFENSVIKASGDATIKDIYDKIKRLASMNINEATYMEFLPQAQEMYQRCVKRLDDRRVELENLAELEKKNKELADKLQKEQEEKHKLEAESHKQKTEETIAVIAEEKQMEVANSQMSYELSVSQNEKVKGVQKRWTFDPATIDLSLLPDEYKTFDEKKIKEAIANGCREIPGVNIYQDVINVSR